MLKKMMSKIIEDTHALGRESMDMILSECLNAVNEVARHEGFAPTQWVLSRLPRNPATMGDEMNFSMWVLCKHMPMDQAPSVCSHVTERGQAKRSYGGTVACKDALLCERPHPLLDHTKLETLSRIAEKHEQVNTDCNGASVRDCWFREGQEQCR